MCGAQFSSPSHTGPRALLLICPMTDPGGHRWITKGIPLPDATLDAETAKKTLTEIQRRIEDREISFGEAFPKDEEDAASKKRLPYLSAIVQDGLYTDYMTGIPGFGERLRNVGKLNAIVRDLQTLFPLDFGISAERGFPKSVVVHGTADREVSVDESRVLVEKLRDMGSEVEFFAVEGEGHRFDSEITDCEDGGTENPTIQALQGCLKAMDCFVA